VERAPGTRRLDPRTQVLVATILGSSMAAVDMSVVNVALPRIGRDLGLGLAGREWVFLSYSLVLASLYLLAGGAGDRVGQRRVFVAGTLGFAAASALAGASQDGAMLIAARALQGCAGAFVTTTSLALLRSTYGRDSGRAVGLWTAWTGVATIVGPPLGGALVQWASWRWIFYLNLPLAALAAIVAHRSGEDVLPETRRPFDAVGAALFAAAFASATYALVEGPKQGFGGVWWAAVVAPVALGAALVYETRTGDPMLPLGLFRHRNFAVANLATLLVYAALGGSTFYLVLYLQTVVGYSPFVASLPLVPISVILIALAGYFGRESDRRGPRLFLTVGPVLIGVSMLLFALVSSKSDVVALGAGIVVLGLGLAVTVAPITATALAAAPPRYSGIAAGVNNTLSRVGNLLAVAVVGLVIALVFTHSAGASASKPLAEGHHSANVTAFRAGMGVAAGLAFAGALVAALGISNAQALRDEAAS
jgi:EmrB/QacA subfamily drug resistance transporter